MKILALLIAVKLLTGCVTIFELVPPFDNPDKINESNYYRTPCFLDGAVVKKKPKPVDK